MQESTMGAVGRWRRIVNKVVQELRTRPGYGFLGEEEFKARVEETAFGGCKEFDLPSDPDRLVTYVSRIAKGVYAEALYHACRSSDVAETNRAYSELSLYLYRIAYNYMNTKGCSTDLAETSSQEALAKIHRSIGQVQKPVGFLGYCITILRHESSRLVKDWGGRGTVENEEALALIADTRSAVATVETNNSLLGAISRLPNKDSRLVLILEHFTGFSDSEIALVLGTTKNNIQVLRHRALASLRVDQEFLDSVSC